MTTCANIIAQAREWDGVPFHWQQASRFGCDCKGLLAGVAIELGLPEADSVYARMMAHRSRVVDIRLLREGLASLFDRVSEPRPSDILLLRINEKPQHLAILTELPGRMIHTNGSIKRVRETPMGAVWWNQLDSIWRWRGLDVD